MKTIFQWMRGWRLREIALASAVAIGVGYSVIYFWPAQDISEFNPSRDTKHILALFDKDLYWLAADPDYDAPFTLKHLSPTHDPAQFGSLHINTLWKDNQFAGFTAYYMEKPLVGRLLFLGVAPSVRGKGYGEKLTRYALQQLRKLGAKKVILATRTNNLAAQKIYERIGFKETHRDENGFLFYEYNY